MTQRRLEDDPAFEAILNCGICFTNMTRPKLLDCSHSFCQSCLQQWVSTLNAWQIKCPLCNKLTAKPWRGIAGLPDDFRLNQFLDCLRKANLDICQHDRNVIKRRGNRDGVRKNGMSDARDEKDRTDKGVDIRSNSGKTMNTKESMMMVRVMCYMLAIIKKMMNSFTVVIITTIMMTWFMVKYVAKTIIAIIMTMIMVFDVIVNIIKAMARNMMLGIMTVIIIMMLLSIALMSVAFLTWFATILVMPIMPTMAPLQMGIILITAVIMLMNTQIIIGIMMVMDPEFFSKLKFRVRVLCAWVWRR